MAGEELLQKLVVLETDQSLRQSRDLEQEDELEGEREKEERERGAGESFRVNNKLTQDLLNCVQLFSRNFLNTLYSEIDV